MAKKKRGRPSSGKPHATTDGRLTARMGIPVPPELKTRLAAVAEKNHRSMATEAVVAIEEHVKRHGS